MACLGANGARLNKKSNTTSTSNWRAVKINSQIEVLRPAFLFYDDVTDSVLISSFGKTNKASDLIQWPLPAHSSVLRLPGSEFVNAFRNRSFSGRKYGREIEYVPERRTQWPNKLSRVPREYGDYIVVPDGFLVPLKSDGNIFFADNAGRVHRITDNANNKFYHEVEWHDFNGDGFKDMLTVRVNKNGFAPGDYDEGDMMWLENPGPRSGNFLKPWKPHYIAKGPDVIFKSIPYNGGLAVFCTEFFRTKAPHNDPRISVRILNSRGQQTAYRIIDANLGLPFAVTLDDLDGDGVKELIATNHQDDVTAIKAAVFAYEVPWNDLINGQFRRHTLVYHPSLIKRPDPGAGSPGFAYPFYPQRGMSGPKHILVAGDGTFDVWYLRPNGRRFQYDLQIVEYPGTTGELLLKDWDGDGIMDVLVPDNDEWGIHGITFRQ